MPHTYCTNLVHCVFSTKNRSDLISEGIREHLYAYMFGIARNLEIEILALGWNGKSHPRAHGSPGEALALQRGSEPQSEFLALDVRERSAVFVAGRLRCVQRQFLACTIGQTLHPQSGRASQEAKFRRGVSTPAQEIRR
jgi:hypothetical protein